MIVTVVVSRSARKLKPSQTWGYKVEHAMCKAHVARELAGVFEGHRADLGTKLARILQMNTAARGAKDAGHDRLDARARRLAGPHQ